jgi:serine/threonine-protein kinase
MRVVFTVVAGPQRGQTFAFTGHATFLVGRSRRAHFRLPAEDNYVSRLHFLVEINPPECRLADLGTKNGTVVNGRKVAEADLKDGDLIALGQTALRVAIAGAAPAAEALPELTPLPGQIPEVLPAPRAPGRGAAAAASCPACGAAVPAGAEGQPLPFLCPACRALAARHPQPVGGYAVLRELGRGMLGTLYLAVRPADRRAVALRVVRPASAGALGQAGQFLRAVRRFAGLDHPHVVALRDLGESAGLLYFAYDYVRGADLAHLLGSRGGALAAGAAAALACQVLQGLGHAHARGLVHGALRPGNVLVTPAGVVRLAEFGLARTYQASPLGGLSLRAGLGNAAGFVAPEQLTHIGSAEPPADQYAAAALLYYLLTGRLVYDLPPQPHRQLVLLLQKQPVPVEARRPDVPRPLAEVLHRALARDPQARFPDVETMRLALVPFAE